jgi:hypothetical protein
MSDIIERIDEMLKEEQWSGDVATKWHPEEGFFEKSAEAIAAGLAKASKDLKQAMSRLNFYINRAGSNLPAARKAALEKAKELLRKKMGGKEEKEEKE